MLFFDSLLSNVFSANIYVFLSAFAKQEMASSIEESVWRTASVHIMSDEENVILDYKLVWVVRPPHSSTELSALCAVLQERLKADIKYVALHHQQVASDLYDKIDCNYFVFDCVCFYTKCMFVYTGVISFSLNKPFCSDSISLLFVIWNIC